jgi:hypothetical protein
VRIWIRTKMSRIPNTDCNRRRCEEYLGAPLDPDHLVEVKFVRNVAPKKAGLRIRIHFIRIRIQHFRLNTNPDPDPIRIPGFNDQKLRKKLQLKKKINFFFFQKLQFTYP